MTAIRYVLLIGIIISATVVTHAGLPEKPEEGVLRPAMRMPTYGLFLSGNAVLSSGTLITTCNCEYGSGFGFDFSAQGFIELPIIDELSLIAQAGYNGLGASYEETETRLEYIDDGDFIFLDFEKTTDVSLAFFNVEALLKWNFGGKPLYLFAGPAVGWLLSGSINETETISTPGYTFQNTGSATKVYLDNEALDEIYSVNSMQFHVHFGVGYEIVVSDAMFVVPEISYSMPITNLVDGFKSPPGQGDPDVTNWKHAPLQVGVRLMYWL